MKLVEVILESNIFRRTFELTKLDSYVNEEVFYDLLKAHNLLLTFHGQRLMPMLLSPACLDVQYEYLEKTYGVDRLHLEEYIEADKKKWFFYNPKDKFIYVRKNYQAVQAVTLIMPVSFKIGKIGKQAWITDPIELERLDKTSVIDLFHVMSISDL